MSDPSPYAPPEETTTPDKWYSGITRYQWMVLLIASLGWVFDVFEGQIFVASMNEAIPSMVEQGATETAAGLQGRLQYYNNVALASFLLGGALGGILFGMLSDRIGRKRTMSLTILFYSLFTCVSAFSQEWWHLAGLRFLVAMGVGGEWAVASALVAEVFPKRARAHVGGIFHASSVFGTYLAVAAGTFLIGNAALQTWATDSSPGWIANFVDPASLPWRMGFALGVLPALLIIWIRKSLKEPAGWQAARDRALSDTTQGMGRIPELFRGDLLSRTMVGWLLAAVGLATFWGTHIYGKNMLQEAVKVEYLQQADRFFEHDTNEDPALTGFIETPVGQLTSEQRDSILEQYRAPLKRWEMWGLFLTTTGGGIGLLMFGPISQSIGRRGAFLLFHVGGLIASLIVFQIPMSILVLQFALPVFGFLTLGMHAGYAIYFPELYPTRIRGTGTGFCFNAGRMLAAPILILSGTMQRDWGFSLPNAASLLGCLFLVGVVLLVFAPETRGRELPE